MIIYISGKMTGLEDLGRGDFAAAEKALQAQGHTVLNPAAMPEGMPKEVYIPVDLAMIDAADAIYLLRSWPWSRGACLEKAYAEYQGKRILFEDEAAGKKLSTVQAMMATQLEHIAEVIAL